MCPTNKDASFWAWSPHACGAVLGKSRNSLCSGAAMHSFQAFLTRKKIKEENSCGKKNKSIHKQRLEDLTEWWATGKKTLTAYKKLQEEIKTRVYRALQGSEVELILGNTETPIMLLDSNGLQWARNTAELASSPPVTHSSGPFSCLSLQSCTKHTTNGHLQMHVCAEPRAPTMTQQANRSHCSDSAVQDGTAPCWALAEAQQHNGHRLATKWEPPAPSMSSCRSEWAFPGYCLGNSACHAVTASRELQRTGFSSSMAAFVRSFVFVTGTPEKVLLKTASGRALQHSSAACIY